jgi:hypothetical protein
MHFDPNAAQPASPDALSLVRTALAKVPKAPQ